MVSITEAARILGITDSSIYLSRPYQPYLFRTEGMENRFDVDGYQKKKEYEMNYISRVQLLIEYVVWEEGLSYNTIAQKINTTAQALHTQRFAFPLAVKVFRSIDQEIIDRFNAYYDFNSKWMLHEDGC